MVLYEMMTICADISLGSGVYCCVHSLRYTYMEYRNCIDTIRPHYLWHGDDLLPCAYDMLIKVLLLL